MDFKKLLDPKAYQKDKAAEKAKKRAPNYGPQQTRKPTNSDLAAPKLTSTLNPLKLNAKALLDPKSSPSKGKTTMSSNDDLGEGETATATPATNDTPQTGMGDSISRLYNLDERKSPLPSKRKTTIANGIDDEDEEVKKVKTTFNGGGSSGIIGEYIKVQRQQGASEAVSNMEPIDLTDSPDGDPESNLEAGQCGGVHEDDGVIMLFSKDATQAKEKEICLGMLHSQAIVWQIPISPKYKSNTLGKTLWPQIRVNYRRSPSRNNIIELFSNIGANGSNAVRFGNMDGKLAAALCPLLDGSNVTKMRLKVYLDPFERKPGEFPGYRTSRALKLRVIVYTPRGKADAIGRILSQKQFFLMEPFTIEAGIEYENPQEPAIHVPARRIKPQKGPVANYVTRNQEEIMREANDMFDSLVKSEDLPEREANENLIRTPLMAHQKQALHFMTERERDADHVPDDDANFSLWKTKPGRGGGTEWYNVITNHQVNQKPEPTRGGILADVMGLGKTLSILALIADTYNQSREFGRLDPPSDDENIERNCKATLIVCPKSVIDNWQQQIKTHTHTKHFRVYSYHGTNRTEDLDELARCEVVLTTYNIASAEFNNSRAKKTALASINWFRIVLDEAHTIRNATTGWCKACCNLSAQRRWAVTGTPVQNKLDDLGALFKFLRIKPFDESMVWSQHIIGPFKAANEHVVTHLRLLVDSITLRRLKDKIGLSDRRQIRERLTFSDEEMAIYSRFAKESNRQLRMMLMKDNRLRGKAYAHVLKSLGRLRAICAHGREMLNEEDQKELEGMTAATAIDLGDEPEEEPDESFITEKHAYDAYTLMIETYLDSCQVCEAKIGDRKDDEDAAATEDSEDSESEDNAPTGDEMDDTLAYLTPCFHLFCPKCKHTFLESTRPNLTDDHYHTCEWCQQYVRWGLFELTRSGLKSMNEARSSKKKNGKPARWDESTYSGPHTKVKALLQDLAESQRETALLPASEPPIRSVVFSGWTRYLDLIEYALEQANIGFVRIDGAMSIKKRSNALQTFNTDPAVTVLLVSIKAGGQGLNFTAANKVYMMEPQFNPGVEVQAIDRVHRLGQKRDVVIKHYIMNDSVEEKILVLQEKKEKLAKLSMERKMGGSENGKHSILELRDLFK